MVAKAEVKCTLFTARGDSITRTSYRNVAGGWVGVCLSQPVLYQND